MTEAHFNYAGAGITSPAVDRAVRDYLDLERELGPYEAEARAGDAVVEAARAAVGGLLGCPPSAVALFDNATRAWGRWSARCRCAPGTRCGSRPTTTWATCSCCPRSPSASGSPSRRSR
ncbi:hypothetical protein ACFQV2_07795 [Actinokineospora soli]|uniref:Aminotransferase class-V n=1 Tax=Actinokineospora soli TaxID=1048753 RepID=A0ABW2TIN1_9PSEU